MERRFNGWSWLIASCSIRVWTTESWSGFSKRNTATATCAADNWAVWLSWCPLTLAPLQLISRWSVADQSNFIMKVINSTTWSGWGKLSVVGHCSRPPQKPRALQKKLHTQFVSTSLSKAKPPKQRWLKEFTFLRSTDTTAGSDVSTCLYCVCTHPHTRTQAHIRPHSCRFKQRAAGQTANTELTHWCSCQYHSLSDYT